MATVVGNSEMSFEKATLEVQFLWKFNGHSFRDYMELNDLCKKEIHSTDEIRFQSGFLAYTDHYMQAYITQEDHIMYVKIYLGKIELPSEFTNHKFSPPRIIRQTDKTVSGKVITEDIKNRLIKRRYFTEDDFASEKGTKLYWFFYDVSDKTVPAPQSSSYDYGYGRGYDRYGNPVQTEPVIVFDDFKLFDGDSITLKVEIDYCFWSTKRKGMIFSIPGEDNGSSSENVNVEKEAALSTKDFLFSPRFSDLLIKCETKSFNTHRMIIASNSVVFAAMFEQPLKEVQEGVVKIDDFKPEVVEEFLRFIYIGEANLDEHAGELFKMSHKYEVADLKKKCEAALILQVNKDNFAEINLLGKLGNSEKLMDKCYSVFKANRSTLLMTRFCAQIYKIYRMTIFGNVNRTKLCKL